MIQRIKRGILMRIMRRNNMYDSVLITLMLFSLDIYLAIYFNFLPKFLIWTLGVILIVIGVSIFGKIEDRIRYGKEE